MKVRKSLHPFEETVALALAFFMFWHGYRVGELSRSHASLGRFASTILGQYSFGRITITTTIHSEGHHSGGILCMLF